MSGILQLKDDANFDLNWLFLINLNTTNDAKMWWMKIFTNDRDQITKYDMKVRLKHIRGEIKGATVCLDELVFENP